MLQVPLTTTVTVWVTETITPTITSTLFLGTATAVYGKPGNGIGSSSSDSTCITSIKSTEAEATTTSSAATAGPNPTTTASSGPSTDLAIDNPTSTTDVSPVSLCYDSDKNTRLPCSGSARQASETTKKLGNVAAGVAPPTAVLAVIIGLAGVNLA
jgi:hypothetical protein